MAMYWIPAADRQTLTDQERADLVEMFARLPIGGTQREDALLHLERLINIRFHQWEIAIVKRGIGRGLYAASAR